MTGWRSTRTTRTLPWLVTLVQFFISVCGGTGQVTLEMIENMEQGEMINMLAQQLDKESPGVTRIYPVAGQGAAAKKFALVHVWVTVSKVQQNMRQYLEREEDRFSNQREPE